MKKTILLLLGACIAGALAAHYWPSQKEITYKAAPLLLVAKDQLTHPQRVWESALEWCESNGNIDAINPKDSDGTPSYYSWQWKPATFRYFATLFGVLATSTSDRAMTQAMHTYATEQKVVDAMLVHAREINWRQQFPDCTHRLGTPPLSPLADAVRS